MSSSSEYQQSNVGEIVSRSAEQTIRIGLRLGELLRIGDVVLLYGDFGAGKTHFTKGIAQGLGSIDMVNSPSFVLVNQYRAGPAHRYAPIYHIDLYRIEDAAAVAGIGLEDALDGHGVCVIEWPERAADWLPSDYLAVYLRYRGENERVIHFEPHGSRAQTLLDQLVARFQVEH